MLLTSSTGASFLKHLETMKTANVLVFIIIALVKLEQLEWSVS